MFFSSGIRANGINTLFTCVGRGNFDNKRLCSRSRNFGIFSNGMFPHFLISQRLKYVANEHINARLKNTIE